MDIDALNASIASMGRSHDEAPGDIRLGPDPIVQFAQWLEDAIAVDAVMPNTMTLATASTEGRPSARIVLLKGFDASGFVFYTNYESRKSVEMTANPHAALVFLWRELERQVRVGGAVERVTRAETEEYWATRPRGSRLGAWASPQSRPVAGRRELDLLYAEADARWRDEDVPAPDAWGGWRLVPDEIEFWKARSDRMHDRWLYRKAGTEWEQLRLAP